jgi:hypothetical protein
MNDPRVKYYEEALSKLRENQAILEEMQFALGLTEAQLNELVYYAKAVTFWAEELKCWAKELGYRDDPNLSSNNKVVDLG